MAENLIDNEASFERWAVSLTRAGPIVVHLQASGDGSNSWSSTVGSTPKGGFEPAEPRPSGGDVTTRG